MLYTEAHLTRMQFTDNNDVDHWVAWMWLYYIKPFVNYGVQVDYPTALLLQQRWRLHRQLKASYCGRNVIVMWH